jgi:hypothetical protein
VRLAEQVLDPLLDRLISSLGGRHTCSLLHAGGVVLGTVYEDCSLLSSGQRWPLPRAATLYGSYARGAADAYSDLDLGLITTDEAYEDFVTGREMFIRLLGVPVFLEDFDLPHMVFCIFSDGTEVELSLGRESQFNHHHESPYTVLLDKKNLLAGAVFSRRHPTQAEQRETLRRLVYWFWHDLSHFITALGRGQL